MHYISRILPLDYEGNFLLAIHFSQSNHKSRESSHAYFATGNVKSLGKLVDITSLCTTDRPPNIDEAKIFQQVSDDIKNDTELALEYKYKAGMELEQTLLVPTTVLCSRAGLIFIGIQADSSDFLAGLTTNTKRVINVFEKKIVLEKKVKSWRKAQHELSPDAISDDGARVICWESKMFGGSTLSEIDLSSFKRQKRLLQSPPYVQVTYLDEHWYCVDDESIYKYAIGNNTLLATLKKPKKVFGGVSATAAQGGLLAFQGDRGLICTLNVISGVSKQYQPHGVCSRDEFAYVELSDDGRLMASRIFEKNVLVVTNLEVGMSWEVAAIHDHVVTEHIDGSYRSESVIRAGFKFIGNELLVSNSSDIRRVDTERPEADGSAYPSEV